MSAESKSVHQQVFDLASLAVENAANDGGMISVAAEAARLIAAHPDSGFSPSELEADIARLAFAKDVVVEFGTLKDAIRHEAAGRQQPGRGPMFRR